MNHSHCVNLGWRCDVVGRQICAGRAMSASPPLATANASYRAALWVTFDRFTVICAMSA
jgi:hypothetical protein